MRGDRGHRRLEMSGRGTAATADQGRARFRVPARVPGEIPTVDGVLEPPPGGTPGQPGVGLGAHRQGCVPDQFGDHGERVLRPERAVGAQRHDRQAGQRDRHLPRGLAAQRAAVRGERGLGDDRRAGQFRGRGDRFGQFVEITEGLQDDHVDAALGERADLLTDRGHPLGGG